MVESDSIGVVKAMPAVRKLAKELGIDLSKVKGSGKNGLILKDDLINFVEKSKDVERDFSQSIEDRSNAELEDVIPLKGIRKAIAKKMVQSKNYIPHVTVMDELDAYNLVVLRENLKKEFSDVKITYLPFIIKAVIFALKKYPILNSSIDEEKEEIIVKYYYNIGIATATEKGLYVPVLKDADKKSIKEIAQEIESKALRAKNSTLDLNELKNGTFTISNIGKYDAQFFTPIINYPEVAILGIGTIKEKPSVVNNSIVIRPSMFLSLSFDHRVIDGDVASLFLNEIKTRLKNPNYLLMEMK